MAWLRGLLFGLQFLVLFLGSLPSPAKCEYGGTPPPPSPLPHPPPKPLKPEYSVSVEGYVYCRCNLPGYFKPKDASPLRGAQVRFKCGRRSWIGATDDRGHFYINAKFPLHKDEDMVKYVAQCGKVHVVSTPLPACTVPEFLEHKGMGAPIHFERNIADGYGYTALFSVGDLVLGPGDSKMCHV